MLRNRIDRDNDDQYSMSGCTGFFALMGLALLGGLLIAGLLLLPGHQGVEVSFAEQTCYLDRDKFELKWLHSVEKQWWVESYQAKADKLLLTDTYLQTFGAGTPSTEKALKNTRPEYQDYVHYQINTTLPYLDWMVSSNIQASLIIPNEGSATTTQGQPLPVYQWVDDYTNIHIAPDKITLWTRLSQEPCHEHLAR